MDLDTYIGNFKGREIVAYCGALKFRGLLSEVLDGGFLILKKVAVVIPGGLETSEYESCVLNVSQVSGIASEEIVGRGVEGAEPF